MGNAAGMEGRWTDRTTAVVRGQWSVGAAGFDAGEVEADGEEN